MMGYFKDNMHQSTNNLPGSLFMPFFVRFLRKAEWQTTTCRFFATEFCNGGVL